VIVRVALGAVLACAAGGAAQARSGARQAPARAGSLILFWSMDPYPSLWSVRPDGSQRRRVYRTRQNCKRPSLSPDRRWVAFDGAPPGKRAMTEFDVQVVRRDGSGRRSLTRSDAREIDPQWSPDGKRISYARLARADSSDFRKTWIWTVRPDGSGARPLVHGNTARWSPDGSRLVFSAPTRRSYGDLFVARSDGTGLRRLLATPALEQPGAWSPDGRRILFTRWSTDGGSEVFSMAAAGGDVRRLTHARGENIGGSWSPDGTRIVFSSTRHGRSHLFVMRAGGGRARELTRREDFDPIWR
jgi:Tol biopolymer transport system component